MCKKYLLLLPTLELGGSERQALNFASYLNRIEEKCTVTSIATQGSLLEVFKKEKITYESFIREPYVLSLLFKCISFFVRRILRRHWWDEIRYSLYFSRYLRRNQYDAVVSYCASANTIAGFAKYFYKGKTKFVWYQRDAGIYNCPDFFQRRAVKKVDLVLANSISGRRFIKGSYNRDTEIIYNGVSLRPRTYSDQEWRVRLSLDEDTLVAVMVANLSSAKDHLSLLKAWNLVRLKFRERKTRLLLAGRFDDQYECLKQFVADNALDGSVSFLGQVNDVTGLLAVSTVFVFSTKSEGSPNAVIEAMLSGLATATTDLPEIREALDEANHEYMSPIGDFNSLAKNIAQLLADENLRKLLGEKNKRKAETLFSPENNFLALLDRLRSISQASYRGPNFNQPWQK